MPERNEIGKWNFNNGLYEGDYAFLADVYATLFPSIPKWLETKRIFLY